MLSSVLCQEISWEGINVQFPQHGQIERGERGLRPPTPGKSEEAIGFLRFTGKDPLEKQFDPRPRGYKFFPCSTQLSMKFILLINVTMPTIVGILTFISMMNTTSERLNARNFLNCRYLIFMSS